MPTASDAEALAIATMRAELEVGLADHDAQALRERVATEVPRYLAANGSRICFHHRLGGDRAGIAFGLIAEMTAELGEGAAQMFSAELFYPGAALVRQLLECGYLLALAGESREEMLAWIGGSDNEIRDIFRPGKMRARSVRGFRFEEYQVHCERGGHPHRAGQVLLRGHRTGYESLTRSHWADLAQHLAEIWDFFCGALPLYDPRLIPDSGVYRPAAAPEGGHDVALLLAEWRRTDPVSQRSAPE